MHIYLAGPMSGIEDFNYPAFRAAAADLREKGYEVTNPVEVDEKSGVTGILSQSYGLIDAKGWQDCLRRDIMALLNNEVDGIVVLPGWEESKGAALEVHVARAMGLPILSYPDLEEVKEPTKYRPPSTETILEEAQRLVGGDRGDDYGHPRDDFAKTAGAWNALFGWDCTPAKVALAMIVVKLSRLQETPHKRDSIVDIAGYARTYEMVLEREGNAAWHYPVEMPPITTGHAHKGGAFDQLSLDNIKASWDRVDEAAWDDLTASVSAVADEDEELRHNYLQRKFLNERSERAKLADAELSESSDNATVSGNVRKSGHTSTTKKGYRLPW